MALIKCFDCGKEISDRAGVCPFCGCPISELLKSSETVKIKLSPAVVIAQQLQIRDTPMGPGDQKVTILLNNKTIWEGRAGDVAELSLVQPTNIEVKYHMSLWRNGGRCSGTIDPALSKTYVVFARSAPTSTKLELRPAASLDDNS